MTTKSPNSRGANGLSGESPRPVSERGFDAAYESPLGWLGIVVDGQAVAQLRYLANRPVTRSSCVVAEQAVLQLRSYFSDPKFCFSIPLKPAGTVFQQAVWQALRSIRVGDTPRYGELAATLNTGARAVGNACRVNPLPIFIPCHRVVSVNGLGGYMGVASKVGSTSALNIKQWLLGHERRR